MPLRPGPVPGAEQELNCLKNKEITRIYSRNKGDNKISNDQKNRIIATIEIKSVTKIKNSEIKLSTRLVIKIAKMENKVEKYNVGQSNWSLEEEVKKLETRARIHNVLSSRDRLLG